MSAWHEPLGNGEPRLPAGWQAALGIAAALLVAIGVALLIAKAAGFSEVQDALAEADSTWFYVCLLAEVGAFAAYALIVREALRWREGSEPGFGLSAGAPLRARVKLQILLGETVVGCWKAGAMVQ